jgi:hypothetical protein
LNVKYWVQKTLQSLHSFLDSRLKILRKTFLIPIQGSRFKILIKLFESRLPSSRLKAWDSKSASQNLESWILDWDSNSFSQSLESWIPETLQVCKVILGIEHTDWFIIHALSLLPLPISQNKVQKRQVFWVSWCFICFFVCVLILSINPDYSKPNLNHLASKASCIY